MKFEMVEISPDIASHLLSRNSKNRRVRITHVKNLSRMMKNGDWKTTHQGIAISSNGELLDGQHRLMAIIDAGVTVKMQVASDVEDEAFKVIDELMPRSLHDRYGGDKRLIEVVRFGTCVALNNKKPDPFTFNCYLKSRLGDVAAELLANTGCARKKFTSAGTRLAACLRVIDGGRKDYVFGQYRATAIADYDSMSKLTKSYVRRVETGSINQTIGGASGQYLALVYGLKIFDESVKDNVLFRVTESEREAYLAYARSVLNIVASNQ